MKIYHKALLASAIIAPAFMMAGSAQAQVSGIAVADPESVILGAKALDAANGTIATTYKAQLDQARARQQALNAEITTLAAPLDTDHDKQLSDKEIAAAEAAKNPALAKIKQAQATAQADLQRLNAPATRAQAYAIEQITQKYSAAMNAVVTNKKISLLLSANTIQFAQPTVDVTDDIKAELDRILPTVNVAPPANWQPAQQTLQLQQQFQQLMYVQAVQRAQQQGQQAPAAPAAPGTPPKPQPQGR